MGIPKFYRWISERYPCLSEIVKEYQLPEFDNLYLDMNGIIHNCSHPDDNNPHFRITEEKIFTDICHYIEVLFRMIKPKKVFFMAVDGVAPRAKMNQQRGRRFRSAREAEEMIKQALMKGENLPKEERFDSNCITPGTEFMARLHEALKYFVAKKVSTDRLWQGPRIYLSGHETPGEGEHKIMDFIRSEKARADYDPNIRHCLYGLDADLIMLGLITHEPHFALLREEVKFTGRASQKRSSAPEEITFHLLHLSLMREYLDYEFAPLKATLSFEYSLERIIDDWVLMGFLVGNDFIPHLPHIHIHQECLPLLWSTYKEILPKLDGYLNDGGFLNLACFEKYLTSLAQFDIEHFQERYADLKWAESKMKKLKENMDAEAAGSVKPIHYKTNSLSSERVGIPSATEFMEQKGVNGSASVDVNGEVPCLDDACDVDGVPTQVDDDDDDDEENSSESSDDENATFASEFKKYKAHYYVDKMEYKKVTSAVLQAQSHGYIKAIQWILHYYYNGVQSWSWYYPHHYAPYLSDVKDFAHLKLEFEMGKPFLPFQQLMAVLPTASKNLLPAAFQSLMVEETSPVIDYYPVNFETDLNGKQQEWEAVVLIPFIDEERLLKAMKPLEEKLLPEEKGRNRHGPHLLYEYTSESLGIYKSPQPKSFMDILNNFAMITEIAMDGFVLPISKLRKGLCEGVQDLFYPGFPTLKHIPHTASLSKAGVKVFQMISRGDNMILNITEQPVMDLMSVAEQIVGRSVFVGWPHLFEAFVVAISDDETRISPVDPTGRTDTSSEQTSRLRAEHLNVDQAAIWHREMDSLTERYHGRWGTDVGLTSILVYAKPIVGRRYICGLQGKVTLEQQWQVRPEPFLFQTVVKDISVYNPSFSQFKTLDDLFPPKTKVFLLGNPHYGCSGEVVDVEKKDDARVRATFTVLAEPDLAVLRKNKGGSVLRYFPGYSIAQRLGITPHLLSRMTGTVYLTQNSGDEGKSNRINIGLNLKFNKTNKEVPGYTRKMENDWQYSNKVADILADYINKFHEVFDCVCTSTQNDVYLADEMFKLDRVQRVAALTAYLKSLPCASVTPVSQGTLQVDDETVRELENLVAKSQELNKKKKKLIKMQVRPHLLYQSLDAQATLIPDPGTTYELFDRIINVRDGYSVPLGLRGTVIGIIPGLKERESIYEVLFDEEFVDGLTIRSSPNRCYQMPPYAMINITYGERKDLHRGHHSNAACNTGHVQDGQRRTNAEMASNGQMLYSDNVKKSGFSPRDRSQPQSKPGFPVPKIMARPQSQEKASNNYENLWNQLKDQQKPNAASDFGNTEAGVSGRTFVNSSSVASAGGGFQPLMPPQAWIQSTLDQQKRAVDKKHPAEHAQSSKSKSSGAKAPPGNSNGPEAAGSSGIAQGLRPQSKKKSESSARTSAVDLENGSQLNDPDLHSSQDGTSSEQQPVSYGQPVKLDDLFKGLRECCSLDDKAPSAEALSAELEPDTRPNQIQYPVVPPAVLLPTPAMPHGIRPTTLAPYESEQSPVQQPHPNTLSYGQLQQHRARAPSYSELDALSDATPARHSSPNVVNQGNVQPLLQSTTANFAGVRPIPPLMGNQPMLNQQFHTALPPHLNMGNSVRMLSMYCHSKGMPEPQYQCQTGADGRCRYVVYLQGGIKFVGSWTRQLDQAAESAAGVTMYHLNATAKKSLFPVGPDFMGSPNSAFTRVQSFHGNPRATSYPQQVPGFMPHQSNMPGFHVRPLPPSANWGPGFVNQPNANFMPSQLPPRAFSQKNQRAPSDANPQNTQAGNFAGNNDQFLNPTPKEQRSTKTKTDWEDSQPNANADVKAHVSNQFIPTQVLRQNKTPHKSSKVPNEDMSSVSSVTEILTSTTPASVPEKSGRSGANVASDSSRRSLGKQATPSDANAQPDVGSASTPLPPRSSKKSRSRLAANFSASKE